CSFRNSPFRPSIMDESTPKNHRRKPAPSADVLELRQLVICIQQQSLTLKQQLNHFAQMRPNSDLREEKYQRACQAAREAEMCEERAEKQLDSKQGNRDDLKEKELEEKVTDLANQLHKQKLHTNKKVADTM
ncbi:hypothetical protein PMAYCL1PPCAC_14532, partial [Pristionchus mayeri]